MTTHLSNTETERVANIVSTLCHKFESPKDDSFQAQQDAIQAIDTLATERAIDELRTLKTHIGSYKASYIGGTREDYDLDGRIATLKANRKQEDE